MNPSNAAILYNTTLIVTTGALRLIRAKGSTSIHSCQEKTLCPTPVMAASLSSCQAQNPFARHCQHISKQITFV